MNRCFFIGHRETSEEILPELTEVINQHIVKHDVTELFVGNYGGFHRIAAKAVLAAKAIHPGITLSMLIPYHPAARLIKLPPGFDNPSILPVRKRFRSDWQSYVQTVIWSIMLIF